LSSNKHFAGAGCLLFLLMLLAATFAHGQQAPIPLGDAQHLYDLTAAPETPLLLPSDIAVAADNRVYVVDSGHHRVVAFGPEGKPLFSFGKRGRAKGEFMGPVGIGVDKTGQVYVADKDNHRIQVFDPDGGFKFEFQVEGKDGGPGRPIDVAVSAKSGLIFVSENSQHRIQVFDADGTLLGGWGKEGVNQRQFRYPGGLTLREGNLYVVDILNTIVKIFDERGQYQYQVGEWGVLPGQFYRPKGVAVDSRGWIYVTDSYMDVVEVFDGEYKFAHVLASNGAKHKFHAPAGMAIDGRDRLYVAEMLGNRVSVFKLH
jgi:DNA-binding beta-propeller fold protein YncE